MNILLTILALPPAVWAADRLFLHGELTAMVREEVRVILAARARKSAAQRDVR